MFRVAGLLTVLLLYQGLALGVNPKKKLPKRSHGISLSQLIWNKPVSLHPTQHWLTPFFRFSDNELPKLSDPESQHSSRDEREQIAFRNGIANQLVRGKVERLVKSQISDWVNSYLLKSSPINSSVIKNLEKKIDRANNIALFESNSPSGTPSKGPSCTVKMGIDLKNSSSKLEYVDESLEVGVYHSRTLSALTGSESFTQNLTFRLNRKWEDLKLRASFDFPVDLPYYRASISRDFSASVSSTISAQAPVRGTTLAKKLEVRFAFNF